MKSIDLFQYCYLVYFRTILMGRMGMSNIEQGFEI